MGENFSFFATLSYLGKQPECLTCRLSFAIEAVAKPEVSKKNKDENDGIFEQGFVIFAEILNKSIIRFDCIVRLIEID